MSTPEFKIGDKVKWAPYEVLAPMLGSRVPEGWSYTQSAYANLIRDYPPGRVVLVGSTLMIKTVTGQTYTDRATFFVHVGSSPLDLARPVRLRNGNRAEIVLTDGPKDRPLTARVWVDGSPREYTYPLSGHHYKDFEQLIDLVNA